MSEFLYVGCNGTVAALRADSGEEAWRTRLPGLFSTGHDVTVIEHEGRVYAGMNGYVFCLDAATGTVLWQNELAGIGYNDVTLSIGGKSVQIVAKRERS